VKLISKKKLADKIGRTTRHIERLLAEGKGPPVIRVGVRAVGFDEDDVDRWLASRRSTPPGWKDDLPPTP
jgi:predicted DNA-binding transcriptional regulator AlpA